MLRWPVQILTGLLAVQLGYSLWLAPRFGTEWGAQWFGFCFNQFPAFCGVLALGFLGALALAFLGRAEKLQRIGARVCFSLLGAASLWGVLRVVRRILPGDLQKNQLVYRMPLAAFACLALVCLALGLRTPLAGLWRFLSPFTFPFYLWHQMLAVFVKYRLRLPAWEGDTPPNQLGDTVWMHQYNRLAWAVAIAAAVLATFLVEKPVARLMKQSAPPPAVKRGDKRKHKRK